MENQIRELETTLESLKKAWKEEQESRYRSQLHKVFAKGDIVTDGDIIGVVEWTSNGDTTEEMGYMGLSIINANRGFFSFAKRDDYTLVEDSYYSDEHNVSLSLTGLEIEELKYSLRCVNSNKVTYKVAEVLNSIVSVSDVHLCEEVLTEDHLLSIGFEKDGEGFFSEPNVKQRDKVWVKIGDMGRPESEYYYRVYHGKHKTFIALWGTKKKFDHYMEIVRT